MARKPQRSAVQNIIKNLLDSEIPEIQATAKKLAEWTKQLEEQSWKLQHYAAEIENLAASEEADVSVETSLAEILEGLERTLDELKQNPAGASAKPASVTKPVIGDVVEEKANEIIIRTREPEKAEQVKHVIPEEEEIQVSPVTEVEREEVQPTKEDKLTPPGAVETYTTPEGFKVRRRRI